MWTTKIVYPTQYESLFREYQNSLNMDTGLQINPSANTGIIHSEPNLTYVKYTKNENYPLEQRQIDYENHLGTKLDYIFFRSFYMLRTAELALLTNQCELESSMILSTLLISIESPRLAGYILTRNKSMFLETNGNVAWLFHCPKFDSPLQLMDACYNRIPIMYRKKIHFVDPIARQTFKSAFNKTAPISI